MSNPKNPVWHSGPPPSIGWWPASLTRDSTALRWFDGKDWGGPAYEGDCLCIVIEMVQYRSKFQGEVLWQDRPESWPARSRT